VENAETTLPPVPSLRSKPNESSPQDKDLHESVATGLGGAFYLLNVALALELYGDFSTPAKPGIALDPWDFVALLGEHLLAQPWPDDALWPLLAELAGRDADQPPGVGFRPPRTWRMPATWIAPFDDARPLTWAAASGRLVLRHAGGFPVADLPRRGRLEEQLARELRRARKVAVAERIPAPSRDPLARWVGWIGDYLRVRIGAAIDAHDPATLSRRLLEHRADIMVSAAHVDVVLRLNELPIEIRLAGLDRTPGWIPAAGRHLAFHFE
jgi:hypothetical protein